VSYLLCPKTQLLFGRNQAAQVALQEDGTGRVTRKQLTLCLSHSVTDNMTRSRLLAQKAVNCTHCALAPGNYHQVHPVETTQPPLSIRLQLVTAPMTHLSLSCITEAS
jgi:hypothetical protein